MGRRGDDLTKVFPYPPKGTVNPFAPVCSATRSAIQLHAATQEASRDVEAILTCVLIKGHEPDKGDRLLHKTPDGYQWTEEEA